LLVRQRIASTEDPKTKKMVKQGTGLPRLREGASESRSRGRNSEVPTFKVRASEGEKKTCGLEVKAAAPGEFTVRAGKKGRGDGSLRGRKRYRLIANPGQGILSDCVRNTDKELMPVLGETKKTSR